LTVLDVAGLVLVFAACFGCYPLWPVVLVVLALPLVMELLFFRKGPRPAEERWALLRVALAVPLFTLTWYLSALRPAEAVHGLGAGVEAKAGEDRLKRWAADVIAAHPEGEPWSGLKPEEIPDFVSDLLGPFQGVRGGEVRHGPDPSVDLFTGGSAYH